ncbi:hypothetical protein KC976_03645 [Candidatus Saccharibacteria bacterium]|nr:hypothetical protein [Candidatus Saccharibacteria bacterium]
MPSKKVIDVKKDAPAEATAKPVIVTNRPIMADPMVKPASSTPEMEPETKPKEAQAPSASKIVIQPIVHDEEPTPEDPVTEEQTAEAPSKEVQETEAPATVEEQEEAEDTQLPADATDKPTEDPDPEDPAEIERQAKLQALVDSQKYFLPITTAEQRKSRRTVILGSILAVLLLLAWADIAVDAGLINLPVNLPHTNFFSVK